MIIPICNYKVICDTCKKSLFCPVTSADAAAEQARANGWICVRKPNPALTTQCICPECQHKAFENDSLNIQHFG